MTTNDQKASAGIGAKRSKARFLDAAIIFFVILFAGTILTVMGVKR